VPHLLQNRESGGSSVPHDLQNNPAAVSAPRPSPVPSTLVSCHRCSAMSAISPCHLRHKVLRPSYVVIFKTRPRLRRPWDSAGSDGSVHSFDVRQPPRLVEESFLWPVEAAKDFELTAFRVGTQLLSRPSGGSAAKNRVTDPSSSVSRPGVFEDRLALAVSRMRCGWRGRRRWPTSTA